MIATHQGRRLVTAGGLALDTGRFFDNFGRPDGELGNGWINGHTVHPTAYDPLGIYQGAVVCTDPSARTGADYADDQDVGDPRPEQYHGIGMAWRDFDTPAGYCEVEWSGLIDIPSGQHVEAAPIVNIVPGSANQGLGLWPSYLEEYETAFFFMAGIGNPPEDFVDVIYGVAAYTHVNGTPRKLGILSTGTHVTFWDGGPPGIGTQIVVDSTVTGDAIGWANGTGPQPLPAELVGSTLHGIECDPHLVSPPRAPIAEIPTTPVIHSFTFQPGPS